MDKQQMCDIFKITDIMYLPAAIMNVLNSDRRDDVYREIMRIECNDYSREWFQEVYEEELAQRKQNDQDFTNMKVAELVSKLTPQRRECTYYEATAGNGGLLIRKWWEDCLCEYPFAYRPSRHRFECWELSDRSLPILLLNLSIRGMVGAVWHGDVLTQEAFARYDLINPSDTFMAFSDIYKTELSK